MQNGLKMDAPKGTKGSMSQKRNSEDCVHAATRCKPAVRSPRWASLEFGFASYHCLRASRSQPQPTHRRPQTPRTKVPDLGTGGLQLEPTARQETRLHKEKMMQDPDTILESACTRLLHTKKPTFCFSNRATRSCQLCEANNQIISNLLFLHLQTAVKGRGIRTNLLGPRAVSRNAQVSRIHSCIRRHPSALPQATRTELQIFAPEKKMSRGSRSGPYFFFFFFFFLGGGY